MTSNTITVCWETCKFCINNKNNIFKKECFRFKNNVPTIEFYHKHKEQRYNNKIIIIESSKRCPRYNFTLIG